MTKGSLSRRLVLLLALLLLGWGALVAALAWRVATQHEHEALQRLSYGLAAHIAQHWPELGGGSPDDPAARQELLRMLMTVNPGIQVYVLDPAGRVQNYIGEPGMVRQYQIDKTALNRFLGGAPLPLYGTDPMGGSVSRLFSVAMFPAPAGSAGYLYIVLDGAARSAVASRLSQEPIWRGLGCAGRAVGHRAGGCAGGAGLDPALATPGRRDGPAGLAPTQPGQPDIARARRCRARRAGGSR